MGEGRSWWPGAVADARIGNSDLLKGNGWLKSVVGVEGKLRGSEKNPIAKSSAWRTCKGAFGSEESLK